MLLIWHFWILIQPFNSHRFSFFLNTLDTVINCQLNDQFSLFFFSYAGFSFGGLINGVSRRFSSKYEYEQVCDASNYTSLYVPSFILFVFRGGYPRYFVFSIFWIASKAWGLIHELTPVTPLSLCSYWTSRKTTQGSWTRPRMHWSRPWSELRPTWTGWRWTRSRCWSG